MQLTLTPVARHRARYPDITQADVAVLLAAHPPRRWTRSRTAMLLLGTLAASQLAGCGRPASPGDGDDVRRSYPTAGADTRKINMAPLFDGLPEPLLYTDPYTQPDPSAAYMALPMQRDAPNIVPLGGALIPAVLTEAEALAIIKSELIAQGLRVRTSYKTVEVPVEGDAAPWTFDLDIDGAKEPVYAEFIPAGDSAPPAELAEEQGLGLSEVYGKEKAAALRDLLGEARDESTGVVFYGTYGFGFSAADDTPEQDLRAQVEAFAEWLKVSGLV